MANSNAPIGLKPVRHRNGAPYNGAANPYFIPGDYATALFIGDPVIKTGTANTTEVVVPGLGKWGVGTLPAINKATAGDGNRLTGTIVGFTALPDNLTKNYNPASTARVAWVCDDPDIEFEVQADGAIPATAIGLNANLVYTQTGSTFTGLSGVELDAAGAAADASNQLLILRAVNREDNDTTLTRAKVLVLINQHTENQGSSGTLGI